MHKKIVFDTVIFDWLQCQKSPKRPQTKNPINICIKVENSQSYVFMNKEGCKNEKKLELFYAFYIWACFG